MKDWLFRSGELNNLRWERERQAHEAQLFYESLSETLSLRAIQR